MRRLLLRVFFAFTACVTLLSLLLVLQLKLGNFHEVVPGEFYRAAQPTGKDLAEYQQKYGIKSIINLRGGNAGDAWYNEEIAAAQQLGITHIDFRMKGKRELSSDKALELVEVMKTAPKPVLIHCAAGADRTGLAAALYLMAVKKEPAEAAAHQLSLRYGHLPLWWIDAQAMDRTLDRVTPQLAPVAP